MVQKWIEFEVLLKLVGRSFHLRELAKQLKAPHTTLLRKLNALVKEDALFTKKEGKNKIYFIKKGLEARNYVFMAEYYKLIKLVTKYPQLSIILKDVVKKSSSGLIVLFGSYAKFTAKPRSDIDLLVLSSNKAEKKKIEMINSRINVKLASRIDVNNLLVKEIIKDHVIIKGVERFYEETKILD